ncbi:hypothetical protein [Halocatena marina]|uniref:hypothetical protein n=1 Tax=Halocatena marina TaxID=2934937 RepID=UPI0036F22977
MAADSDGDIPPNQNKPHSATRFLGVVILLSIACVWFFRPWLHGPIYGLYTTPILWVGIPVCLLIGVIGLDRINYPAAQQALVIVCIVGLLRSHLCPERLQRTRSGRQRCKKATRQTTFARRILHSLGCFRRASPIATLETR